MTQGVHEINTGARIDSEPLSPEEVTAFLSQTQPVMDGLREKVDQQ